MIQVCRTSMYYMVKISTKIITSRCKSREMLMPMMLIADCRCCGELWACDDEMTLIETRGVAKKG